jgi:hypothetical protein
MGKKIKKALGAVTQFDSLLGTDLQGKKADAAKKQAQQQEAMARQQAAAAAEASRGQTLAMQADAARQQALSEAQALQEGAADVGAPTVELAGAPGAEATRRKKFKTSSVGISEGGVSLRV